MSNYLDEMHDYERASEAYFDDYAGFEGVDPNYSNYHPSTIGRIEPHDGTYTIKVTNTGRIAQEAIVFGGLENPDQPTGLTVEVQESSHSELREESKFNPFKIVGMKMSVSDGLQFDNVLRIVHRRSGGYRSEHRYQPRNATSPQNFNGNLIDDVAFEMNVTGHDSLRFLVNAGATVVFTFSVKARANMGNLLHGKNVAEMSTDPRTTGLPQIDMIRKEKPSVFGLPPSEGRPLPPPRYIPEPRPASPPRNYVLRKRDRR